MLLRNGKTYNINNEVEIEIKKISKQLNKIKNKLKKELDNIKVSTEKYIEKIENNTKDTENTKNMEDKKSKPVLDIDKYSYCAICADRYKINDTICSCKLENINKHSFHKTCIRESIKYQKIQYYNYNFTYSGYNKQCPYCNERITQLKYVKIMT